MSDDLIRRSDAIKAVEERSFAVRDSYTVKAILRNVPSADRPQGEWEDYDRYMKCCSKCGWIHDILHYGVHFCPNCGARMKGATDGNK